MSACGVGCILRDGVATIARSWRDGLYRGLAAATFALPAACGASPDQLPTTIHLVDQVGSDRTTITDSPTPSAPARALWRFDVPDEAAAWQDGGGLDGLAVREGRLGGRSRQGTGFVHAEWPDDGLRTDRLYAVEIEIRVSQGTTLEVGFRSQGALDLDGVREDDAWALSTPLLSGDELRTYEILTEDARPSSAIHRVFVRPSDEAGAEFEIASVRLVFDREHLAETPSGVAWRGQANIYRETLVAKAPETVRFPLVIPDRSWLDLSLGTMTPTPTTFRVTAESDTDEIELFTHTITTPDRWEPVKVDLASIAGRQLTLALTVESAEPAAIGLWGAPVIRRRGPETDVPQGVIVVMADTLRPDHMGLYGHNRETTPALAARAAEGVRFDDALAQATWTKTSTPSILTSLYPLAHGVLDVPDRLPSAAVTLAEVYRAAGYATVSFSSVSFTGADTNLHQGFEELHEATSRTGAKRSKSAREYVDRLLEWLDRRDHAPFFAFLHVFDPHSPFEPRPPYDTWWADPEERTAHQDRMADVRLEIESRLLRGQVMPTRAQIEAAGVDVDQFMDHRQAWYDGSIRGMDAELGRLFEWLEARDLSDHVIVAVLSDHGEEFLEHGESWHGHTVYGEQTRIPLLLWGPGRIPSGRVVTQTVRSIDLMPTLLELSGLVVPGGVQGQSLLPLMRGPGTGTDADASQWVVRAAVAEEHTRDAAGVEDAHASVALVLDGWRLIHNEQREPDEPEFELYGHAADPMNQTDLATEHPEVVERLGIELDRWRRRTAAGRLPSDEESTDTLSSEELERLRGLGYLR